MVKILIVLNVQNAYQSVLENVIIPNFDVKEYFAESRESVVQPTSDLIKIPAAEMLSYLSYISIDTQKYFLNLTKIFNSDIIKSISAMPNISNMIICVSKYAESVAEGLLDVSITDDIDYDLEMDSKSYQDTVKSVIDIVRDAFNNLEDIGGNWIDNIKDRIDAYSKEHPKQAKIINSL